jgi:hypothetical protein
MSGLATRILVIGSCTAGTKMILDRLEKRGWRSQGVATLREGKDLLGTCRFDVVLSSESISDGRGYDVSGMVASQSGTLLVGVALSESLLWLPVVDRGLHVLGKRAMNATIMESETENLLSERDPGARRVANSFAMKGGIPRLKKASA